MADISKEIQAFRDAVYGEEVRGSMISALEKVNADGEDALSEVAAQVTRIDGIAAQATQTLNNANTAINTANEAIERADDILEEGESQVQQAAGSATLSKSWARGGTGTRSGEDSDNSRYYSLQSQTEADRAKVQADRAEMYAGFVMPEFWVNFVSGKMEYTDTDQMQWIINTATGNMEYAYI
ncbi:hypothetical protein [Lacrimispora indolis]|uniref:hypothetical protein n=1 Tax=Lacrimispora indolis TaxID=69825 RepID=UPI00040E1336|nr:hypothetical protein [[Clostridium] methoxybenzovorans]